MIWFVQYLDNQVNEGQTAIGSNGDGHKSALYMGPLTWLGGASAACGGGADNSGGIRISGNMRDAIVEGCALKNENSTIEANAPAAGGRSEIIYLTVRMRGGMGGVG